MTFSPPLSHCASLIRAHDHDRYLCALFAPAEVREAWFALFAFNHELAAIPDAVSEEMIGFMRFAWWREALDAIYGGGSVRRHPVAEALAQVVTAHHLPRAPFDTLLEAREAKFGGEPFAELVQWENYFRATSSGLLELCALTAGGQPTAALVDLGIAWACVGTARRMGEESVAGMLRQAALQRLNAWEGLPEIFMPFHDAALFYLKQLGRGKKAGHKEATFPLLLALCWRHCLRRISRRGRAGRLDE